MKKIHATPRDTLVDLADGATVMIGGFGNAGQPQALIDALIAQGATGLTVINNNAGNGDDGLAALVAAGRVKKVVCSFPRQADSWHFDRLYRERRIELELVPQGTLAERIRAAGAGVGGFYTRTGVGTPLAAGKELRLLGGHLHQFEEPLHADFALIHAECADAWGNLTYRKSARNFNPVMATAARFTVVSVHELRPLGGIDPEAVVTPGIFVDRIVQVARPLRASPSAGKPA